MNEHLFLDDSTYPHLKEPSLVDQLRNFSDQAIVFDERVLMHKAADRIEQLERELAEAQKGHARYEFVRKLNVYQFKKIFTMNLTSAVRFDDLIDAAIKEWAA